MCLQKMNYRDHSAAIGSQDNSVKKESQEVFIPSSCSKDGEQGHIMQSFSQPELENH